MTTQGIYNLAGEALIDKSGDPYMPEDVFTLLVNNAIGVLCTKWYEDFQKTQDLSDKAAPLVNPFTLTGVTQIIPATDLPGYWHILPMQGLSVYSCNGISKSEWRPITPVKFKEWATIDSDPFNKPSERNIYYAESKNLISQTGPDGHSYTSLVNINKAKNNGIEFTARTIINSIT